MTPKHYFGNYPNSADYDDNVPIGWNKWDDMEADDDSNEPTEDEVDENEEYRRAWDDADMEDEK